MTPGNHDLCARLGETDRGRFADTTPSAGHDGDFPSELLLRHGLLLICSGQYQVVGVEAIGWKQRSLRLFPEDRVS